VIKIPRLRRSIQKASTVGDDAVFKEMFTEMRRYRDRQFDLEKWFTSIMLAIVGGIFALYRYEMSHMETIAKVFLTIIVFIQGIAVSAAVLYSRVRFRFLMEKISSKELFFDGKQSHFRPSTIFMRIPMIATG